MSFLKIEINVLKSVILYHQKYCMNGASNAPLASFSRRKVGENQKYCDYAIELPMNFNNEEEQNGCTKINT